MICNHCGKPNSDTSLFCIHCRQPLSMNAAPMEPKTDTPVPQASPGPKRQTVEDFRWSDQTIQDQPAAKEGTQAQGGKKAKDQKAQKTRQNPVPTDAPKERHREAVEKKDGKKTTHSSKTRKAKSHRHSHKPRRGGGILPAIRLGLGLGTVAIFAMVAHRAVSAGAFQGLLADPIDPSGVWDLWPAALMLLAGITGIAARHSRAGGIFAGILYLSGAVSGFLRPGYSIRPINWPILCFFIGAAFFFLSGQSSGKREKRSRDREREPDRKRGGAGAFFLIFILLVLLGAAIAAGVYIVGNGLLDDGQQEQTDSSVETVTYGQRFHLDGLDLVFRNDIGWMTHPNDGSDVFGVPVTIGNDSDETRSFRDFTSIQYGSAGTRLNNLGSHFSEDVIHMGALNPGEQRTAYLHFLYDGDGEYSVHLEDDAGNTVEVRLPVTRPEAQSPPPAESAVSGADSSSRPESSTQEESESQASSDSAPDDVTYVIPPAYVDSSVTGELTDRDVAMGIRSIVLNADGSATVTISKSGHEGARQAAVSNVETYIAGLQSGASPFRKVEMNAAMTEASIMVDRDGNDRDFDPSVLSGLYNTVSSVQILDGRSEITLNVLLRDQDTGEAFQALVYPSGRNG